MLAWAAMSACLMARKGLMDDNAYAEADRYPWKHYLVQGVLAGVGRGCRRVRGAVCERRGVGVHGRCAYILLACCRPAAVHGAA